MSVCRIMPRRDGFRAARQREGQEPRGWIDEVEIVTKQRDQRFRRIAPAVELRLDSVLQREVDQEKGTLRHADVVAKHFQDAPRDAYAFAFRIAQIWGGFAAATGESVGDDRHEPAAPAPARGAFPGGDVA